MADAVRAYDQDARHNRIDRFAAQQSLPVRAPVRDRARLVGWSVCPCTRPRDPCRLPRGGTDQDHRGYAVGVFSCVIGPLHLQNALQPSIRMHGGREAGMTRSQVSGGRTGAGTTKIDAYIAPEGMHLDALPDAQALDRLLKDCRRLSCRRWPPKSAGAIPADCAGLPSSTCVILSSCPRCRSMPSQSPDEQRCFRPVAMPPRSVMNGLASLSGAPRLFSFARASGNSPVPCTALAKNAQASVRSPRPPPARCHSRGRRRRLAKTVPEHEHHIIERLCCWRGARILKV